MHCHSYIIETQLHFFLNLYLTVCVCARASDDIPKAIHFKLALHKKVVYEDCGLIHVFQTLTSKHLEPNSPVKRAVFDKATLIKQHQPAN